MNITNLPKEILCEVFSHLPDRELPNAASTCQYFNKIFDNEMLWNLKVSTAGLSTRKYKDLSLKNVYIERVVPIRKIAIYITRIIAESYNIQNHLLIRANNRNEEFVIDECKPRNVNVYSNILKEADIDIKKEQHTPFRIISALTDNLSNKCLKDVELPDYNKLEYMNTDIFDKMEVFYTVLYDMNCMDIEKHREIKDEIAQWVEDFAPIQH